jgi:hypothetical protein
VRRILVGFVFAALLAVVPASAQAASGDIFVSEPFAGDPVDVGAVIKIDSANAQSYLSKEGNLPTTDVNQVAFEPSGNVVVAIANGSVVRVTPAGAQSIVSSGTNLVDTFGIAVGPTGQIFVTDSSKVFRIDPVSGAQTLVPDGDDVLLNGAKGLTVAPNGDIFVVVGTGLIKISGGTASTFSSDALAFQNPQAVARDSGGNLYVANRFGEVTGNILKVGPGGGAPTLYIPTTNTLVNQPVAIATDRLDNLVVAALAIGGANNPGVVRIDPAKNTAIVTSGGDLLQDARGIAVDTTAPPPSGGGGTPDKSITATVSAKKSQKLKSSITVDVSCPQEACTASASGTLTVPKVSASKRYNLKQVSKSLKAGEKGTLKLKLSKSVRNKAKRALRKHKKVSAKISVTATDAAGNKSSQTLKVKLKK